MGKEREGRDEEGKWVGGLWYFPLLSFMLVLCGRC